VKIPNGFAITADAYRYMLDKAGAWHTLHDALEGLTPDDLDDLAKRGARARDIVYGATLPDDLRDQILAAFHALKMQYSGNIGVAVRSIVIPRLSPSILMSGMQGSSI